MTQGKRIHDESIENKFFEVIEFLLFMYLMAFFLLIYFHFLYFIIYLFNANSGKKETGKIRWKSIVKTKKKGKQQQQRRELGNL